MLRLQVVTVTRALMCLSRLLKCEAAALWGLGDARFVRVPLCDIVFPASFCKEHLNGSVFLLA